MGLPSSGAEESQANMRYRFGDLHYNALHMTFDILLGCVQNQALRTKTQFLIYSLLFQKEWKKRKKPSDGREV